MTLIEFLKEYWWIITPTFSLFVGGWRGIMTLNNTLQSIEFQLKKANEDHQRDYAESIADRAKIHVKLNQHDGEIDELEKTTTKHEEQIKTLYQRSGI